MAAPTPNKKSFEFRMSKKVSFTLNYSDLVPRKKPM